MISVGSVSSIVSYIVQPLESVTITVYVPSVRLLISCVISPLLHWYVYGLTPPVTERSIDPVESPWQRMLVFTEESIIESGCVMYITNESIHKLESVTITVYVPSVRSLISCVISPLLHWYVYGLTPPDTERSIDPVESPKHRIFVLMESSMISVGSVSSIVSYTVHPLESVTITLYVPADKESISSLIEL